MPVGKLQIRQVQKYKCGITSYMMNTDSRIQFVLGEIQFYIHFFYNLCQIRFNQHQILSRSGDQLQNKIKINSQPIISSNWFDEALCHRHNRFIYLYCIINDQTRCLAPTGITPWMIRARSFL